MKFLNSLAALVALSAILSGCTEKIDTPPESEQGSKDGKYIVVAKAGETNYILTTDDLSASDKLTVLGNGLALTRSASRWVSHENGMLFGIIGMGGSTWHAASYILNEEGNVEQKFYYEGLSSNSAHGIIGDYLVTTRTTETSSGNDFVTIDGGEKSYAKYFNEFWLSSIDGKIEGKPHIAENYVGNGEACRMVTMIEAGGKVYVVLTLDGMTPYAQQKWPDKVLDPDYPAKGDASGGGPGFYKGEIPITQYPDEAWVAVYNSREDFVNRKAYKTFKTDKMSAAYTGAWHQPYSSSYLTDDEEYIYLFSAGGSRTHKGYVCDVDGDGIRETELKTKVGTKPSSVMRIKVGEENFDASYDVVNIEAADIGAYTFTNVWYMNNHNFLLKMYNEEGAITSTSAAPVSATRLAIYNGETKKISWVTGLPDYNTITSIGVPYSENGLTYIPIVTETASMPSLYVINAVQGTATKGRDIETDEVSAINYLKAK